MVYNYANVGIKHSPIVLLPICEPWCLNPNICPCPKSPSHVGKYTSTMEHLGYGSHGSPSHRANGRSQLYLRYLQPRAFAVRMPEGCKRTSGGSWVPSGKRLHNYGKSKSTTV